MAKARNLRPQHNLSEDQFKVSKGWLDKFLGRHAVKASGRLHGEAGSVDRKAIWEDMVIFCRKLYKYPASRIYNEDESAIIY